MLGNGDDSDGGTLGRDEASDSEAPGANSASGEHSASGEPSARSHAQGSDAAREIAGGKADVLPGAAAAAEEVLLLQGEGAAGAARRRKKAPAKDSG